MLAAEGRIEGFPPSDCIVLDVETTGVRDDDEILRILAVDGHGRGVMDQLFRPERHLDWPKAEAINGISPYMVKDAPAFSEIGHLIWRYLGLYGCIIGYGLGFDIRMLASAGLKISDEWKLVDVRELYAKVAGGGYGPPLANVAMGYGFKKVTGRFVKPRMTLFVLENLMYEAEKAGYTLDELLDYYDSKGS